MMIYYIWTTVHDRFIVTFTTRSKRVATHAAIAKTLFLHNGAVFPNKSHLILKYIRSRIYLSTAPQRALWSVFCIVTNGLM